MFELIATNTNHYAEYCQDQKGIKRNDPNYKDSYWQDTHVVEIEALFGVAILIGINSLLQAKLYFDRNQFNGKTGIKKKFTALWYKKLM